MRPLFSTSDRSSPPETALLHLRPLPSTGGRSPPPETCALLVSLGFGPATPLPHGAPPAAQAESRPVPARVGSQPDPGFALQEGLHPPLSRSASARRCPCSLARLPESAAQAQSRHDPTRVGSRPYPGFARRGEAAPFPASLGFGPATPMQSGMPSTMQAESGQDPPEWAPGPNRPSPGGDEAVSSPESLGIGSATPMQSGAPSTAKAEPGPDPT